MLSEPLSPELVLVLPDHERLAALAALPRPFEFSVVSTSPRATNAVVLPLRPPRLIAAAVVYTAWQFASMLVFCGAVLLGMFALTVLLAALA
jgi:hypothetical protein